MHCISTWNLKPNFILNKVWPTYNKPTQVDYSINETINYVPKCRDLD